MGVPASPVIEVRVVVVVGAVVVGGVGELGGVAGGVEVV